MAKKKVKNMKLEQDELKATTIGIFENRKKSSIGIVLLLMLFILVVFFLPDITEVVENYLNPPVSLPPSSDNPIKPIDPTGPDTPSKANDIYEFKEDLKIERDDITLSNFVKNIDSTLSYTVTNNMNTYQNIEELNYYLELYNSEQTMIERVKLSNENSIASGAFQVYTKRISGVAYQDLGYISLVKKGANDYPQVNISTTGDGKGVLTCTLENEKVTYNFTDSKLKAVVSEYSNTAAIDNNYQTNYEKHSTESGLYNNRAGVISVFILNEARDGYKITTNVNLEEASRFYVFSADTFKLDVTPDVVKFQMEAQGFKCS